MAEQAAQTNKQTSFFFFTASFSLRLSANLRCRDVVEAGAHVWKGGAGSFTREGRGVESGRGLLGVKRRRVWASIAWGVGSGDETRERVVP